MVSLALLSRWMARSPPPLPSIPPLLPGGGDRRCKLPSEEVEVAFTPFSFPIEERLSFPPKVMFVCERCPALLMRPFFPRGTSHAFFFLL